MKDGDGVEHDVRPLVINFIKPRNGHTTQVEGACQQNDAGGAVRPTNHFVVAGMELGLKLAISSFYGKEAEKTFSDHCKELQWFLVESDTTRH